jgi:hypothetical protein
MNAEVAESLAGVVRLLRRSGALVWGQVSIEGPGSARQLLGVGIDVVVDEAALLLLPAHAAKGPVPVGDNPVRLLRSAEQLLARLNADAPAEPAFDDLRNQVLEQNPAPAPPFRAVSADPLPACDIDHMSP